MLDIRGKSSKQRETRIARAILGGIAIGSLLIVFLIKKSPGTTSPSPRSSLNQQGVKLAAYAILDDFRTGLLNGESVLGKDPGTALSDWTGIEQKTTARDYEAAYDANEIAADNQFKDKKIFISGSIATVEKDFTGSGYLTLQGTEPFLGVRADLNDASMAGAATFKRGQEVNLVCTGAGRIVSIAVLNSCQTLDDYLAGAYPGTEEKITHFLDGSVALKRNIASVITLAYTVGILMPPNSACLNGDSDACGPELDAIVKDKERGQAIKNQSTRIMATLKVID